MRHVLCTGCRRLKESFATCRSRGGGKRVWCEVEFNATVYTHIFCSPQLSGKQVRAAFPFLGAGAFRLGRRCLLLGRKGSLEVPN